jgi:hypothetical protein
MVMFLPLEPDTTIGLLAHLEEFGLGFVDVVHWRCL